ncbi:MAG: hypothetical protein D4R93_03385 [Deltaproteobacteria bacterium]|nr:MAG: hypothetical protein D4R93_03385 [Deltaproteobacteria bacterium]
MFELTFEVNGKRVDPSHIGDVIEKAMLQKVTDHITQRVGSVTCPEHGSSARITAKGSSISDLSFTVSGCCQKLIDAVQSKLSS